MPYIIRGNSTDGSAQSTAVDDRVEALRAALEWQNAGFRKLKITADGRVYSLMDFAGTITIGPKPCQN